MLFLLSNSAYFRFQIFDLADPLQDSKTCIQNLPQRIKHRPLQLLNPEHTI